MVRCGVRWQWESLISSTVHWCVRGSAWGKEQKLSQFLEYRKSAVVLSGSVSSATSETRDAPSAACFI